MENKYPHVEFISYDGKFPNLCSGELILLINGIKHKFPLYCMSSGGKIWFDNNYNEHIEYGEWSVDVPKELKEYEEEINYCVNEHVVHGCCGGCI